MISLILYPSTEMSVCLSVCVQFCISDESQGYIPLLKHTLEKYCQFGMPFRVALPENKALAPYPYECGHHLETNSGETTGTLVAKRLVIIVVLADFFKTMRLIILTGYQCFFQNLRKLNKFLLFRKQV